MQIVRDKNRLRIDVTIVITDIAIIFEDIISKLSKFLK